MRSTRKAVGPRWRGPRILLRVCLLLDHDHAGHERSVYPTLIGVRPGMLERHRIAGVVIAHDHTIEKDVRRAGRLDAVRPRRVPAPRHSAPRGTRVHGT